MKAIQKQTAVWGGVFLVVGWMVSTTQAALLFEDQFNGSLLDLSKWTVRENFILGRTLFRSDAPVVSNGFARLRFDTSIPGVPSSAGIMHGAEIFTKKNDFEPNANRGVSVETRIRVPAPIHGGLVAGAFGFEDGEDEIDFELLSNDIVNTPNSDNRVLTNTFKGAKFEHRQFITEPGLDLTDWNTFKFNWFTDRIEFFLNGVLVRTTTVDLPMNPMTMRFNFWAPSSGFSDAYDPTLVPPLDPADNETYFFDVDYLTVTTIPEPLTASVLVAGMFCLAFRRRPAFV